MENLEKETYDIRELRREMQDVEVEDVVSVEYMSKMKDELIERSGEVTEVDGPRTKTWYVEFEEDGKVLELGDEGSLWSETEELGEVVDFNHEAK